MTPYPEGLLSVCKPPAFRKKLISICLQFWVLGPQSSKESHGEMDLPTPHQCLEKDPPGFYDTKLFAEGSDFSKPIPTGGLSTLPEVFGSQGKSDSGLIFVTAGDRDGSVSSLAMSSLSFVWTCQICAISFVPVSHQHSESTIRTDFSL